MDIVDRLRGYKYDGHLLTDAADDIETLRARVENLELHKRENDKFIRILGAKFGMKCVCGKPFGTCGDPPSMVDPSTG